MQYGTQTQASTRSHLIQRIPIPLWKDTSGTSTNTSCFDETVLSRSRKESKKHWLMQRILTMAEDLGLALPGRMGVAEVVEAAAAGYR